MNTLKAILCVIIRTARLVAGQWLIVCVLLSAADVRAAEPAFTNVTDTVAPGLPAVKYSAVAWGDFDNDGRLDLLLTGYSSTNNYISQLWRNTGDGFTNVTAALAPDLPGVYFGAVAWADFDNDGHLDFLLTGISINGPISQLWRNTGNGFTNVTAALAPDLPGLEEGAVAWSDYDNDGRLDLILTGAGKSGTNFYSTPLSQVWRNTGNGFTNVTANVAPGLPGLVHSCVAFGDYDNDGWLDFLITGTIDSNCDICDPSRRYSQLWRNTGSGFVPANVAYGLQGIYRTSVAWADYDNDGRLDFIVGSELWQNIGKYFVNTFLPIYEVSAAWGDYDNDGRLDLLVSGLGLSQVWRNTGNGFTNVTASVAPGLLGNGSTFGTWADYDNDGRLDFLLTGSLYATGQIAQLWRNTSAETNLPTAVITRPPMSVTATSMVLSASINPNRHTTVAWFTWGDSTNYGQLTPAQPVGNGNSLTNFSQRITGFSTGVTYYYRAAAFNDRGQVVFGNEQHFMVVAPVASYVSVSSLTTNSAKLSSYAYYPIKLPLYGWYEWGPTPAFGQASAMNYLGGNNAYLYQTLSNLSSSTTYYFHLVVSNGVAASYGPTQRFVTPDPDTCAYDISPMERNHGYGATTNTIGIRAPNSCAWLVSNTNSWITILSGASGLGYSQVVYAVEANADVLPRSGNINVGGWYFSITQEGHYDVSKPDDQIVALGGAATFSVTVHGTPPFTYQWQFNGVDLVDGGGISGATTATLVLTHVQYSQAGHYRVIVTDADSTTPSSSATLTVAPTSNALPLAEALDSGETFFWKTWGDSTGIWFGQTNTTHDGIDAAQCSGLSPGAFASLEAKADGAGILSFWWKTDLAAPSDSLQFWIGSSPSATLTNTTDWEQRTFAVPPGGVDLGWTLNSSVGEPSKAWLDQVHFTPCVFFLPSNFSSYLSYAGATATITVDSFADCPWRVVNTNSWITILSGVEYHGGGSVIYAVAANTTGAARVGTLVIAEQSYSVYQQGGPSNNVAISLAAALDTEDALEWSTIGTPEWFGQTIVSRDGSDAAQSGPVGDSGAVTALTTVNGPGTVLFWWKVSSETNKDYLKFFINGVQQTRISGEVDWHLLSYDLTSITNTLKWTYSKNATNAMGQDRGWLDQVQFIPAPPTGGCVVAVSPISATHSINSVTGLVYVVAAPGCGWEVVNTNSWITSVASPGDGNGFVRYTLSANNSRDPRTGVLLIGGRPFTVTQFNWLPPCSYSLSTLSRTYGPASANGTISVTTQSGCEWSVFNTNDWITITSSLINSGAGQMNYSIAQNSSHAARSGVIFVAGQIFRVSQNGIPLTLMEALDIVGTPLGIWDPGSFFAQTLVTHDGVDAAQANGVASFIITVNGPGTLSFWWKISSATNSDFRFFLSGSLEASISGQVDWEQRTVYLPPGPQSLEWFFANNGFTGSTWVDQVQFVPISLCPVTLSPASASHPASASSGSVGVAAAADCTWNVYNTNAWVTVFSISDGSGNGQVNYSVSSNQTSVARSGTLMIGDQNFFISQSGNTNIITLSDALDTRGTPLVWITGGTLYWSGQRNVSHDGVDAAKTWVPSTSGSGSGSLQTYEFGAGTLSFWWKVSSETNNDTLRFYLNGAEQTRISGEVDWQYRTFTVPAGSNSLEWRYTKDASTSAGQDAAWLDQVQFIPDTNPGCTVVLSPTNRTYGFRDGAGFCSITAASTCNWTVINTNAWIAIVTPLGGTGNGGINYTIAANPTSSTRSGNITVNGQNFLVTQFGDSGTTCTVSIAPTSRAHGYASATGTVAVTTQTGCAWGVVKTNSWISILSSLVSSNSGTVLYSITANTNTQARSGYINIGGQRFFLTQAGAFQSGTNAPRLQFMGTTEVGATLFVQGQEGKMYVVECSEDLIHWTPISTNSAASTVTDAAVGNAPRRCYRTRELP